MSIYLKPPQNKNGWDRTCLHLSSKMAEPFCAAWHLIRFRLIAPVDPQKFECSPSIANEVAIRALISLSVIVGGALVCVAPLPTIGSVLTLGIGSKLLRAIGFKLQKEGYTHIRSEAKEKSLNPQDPQLKVMSWNMCGVGGGMSLDHGGVIHWRSRLDRLIQKMKAENPDVLILQEIYDTALAEALVNQLKSEYAHFFIHLGQNIWGSVGGCMVLSKCAIHNFCNTSFENNHWTLNRTFASLELKATPQDALPCVRIIGTHFIHGDDPNDKKNRLEQVEQIVRSLAKQTLAMPTILAGDLNIERDQKEGAILSRHLHHGYQQAKPTCTNHLVAQWDDKARGVWGETIDYISLFKNTLPNGNRIPVVDQNVTLENCHLIEAFDDSYNTKTALSDHHGIALVIKGLRPAKLWHGEQDL